MRIRLRFSKLGKVRFTSQRDVARMWERALRRDEFPVAYSAGFSPRPQLSFGLALPTGCESLAEYVDVAVDPEHPQAVGLEPVDRPARLGPLLPDGVDVTAAGVLEHGSESLQEEVTSCRWVFALSGESRAELAERLAAAMAADSLPIVRQRKGRSTTDDLRPSIIDLALGAAPEADGGEGGTVDVVAELATHPRGVRPGELLAALAVARPQGGGPVAAGENNGGLGLVRACRTNQWIESDGSRREPLPEAEGPAWRPIRPAPVGRRAP